MDKQPLISDLLPLAQSFFLDDADAVAQKLIGTWLILDHGIGYPAGGRIIETEAYDETDPASYCFRDDGFKPTAKSEPMRLAGGHAYVYADACLNFVCGKAGFGSGVLIRALEPIWGIDAMIIRNAPYDPKAAKATERLCRGPLWLGGALGVTYKLNKMPLNEPPFKLYDRISVPQLFSGPRVGVRKFLLEERSRLPPEKIKEAEQKPSRYVDANCLELVSARDKESDKRNYPLSEFEE
jgi:DNA-3-methyladenine glycosylase